MNILIVDDNPTNRKLLRVTLGAEGFTALEAADGLEALALLERQPVEVVISDILMPRMDGFRLCQELRRHPRLGGVPFIIYSATYTSPGDEKLALDCGADRYLRKPCPTADVVAAIREVASTAQRRRPPRIGPAREAQVMRAYNEALVQKLEHRRAELERQREWLRVTLASIADGVIAVDTLGRITFLNPVAAALTGWQENEALGQPIQGVFNVADEHTRQPEEDLVGRVLRDRGVVRLADQTSLLTRDGREILLEHSAAPIQDSAGQTIGAVLVFRDVTEKRRAEQALRASEARFRTLASFTSDWEYWRNPDGRFEFVSPSCERLTGYTPEEFSGDPELYLRTVHPEDRARVRAHLREDLTHTEPCELEFRVIRRDGQERWVGHACLPILDAHGRLAGRRASNRDITERKRMEVALLATNRELERFNRAMVGRELRMLELKQEVNALCAQAGLPPRYPLDPEAAAV